MPHPMDATAQSTQDSPANFPATFLNSFFPLQNQGLRFFPNSPPAWLSDSPSYIDFSLIDSLTNKNPYPSCKYICNNSEKQVNKKFKNQGKMSRLAFQKSSKVAPILRIEAFRAKAFIFVQENGHYPQNSACKNYCHSIAFSCGGDHTLSNPAFGHPWCKNTGKCRSCRAQPCNRVHRCFVRGG